MKINLLKKEMENYNDNDIILFSDSYDVIFLSDENEILEKYNEFNCDIVFGAEKTCWPDVSLSSYFSESDTVYKYLNSGGFIGNAKTIKLYIENNCSNTQDDQLFMQQSYFKYKNITKLDTTAKIFQTSSNDILDDVYTLNNRIINKLYNTKPCHLHGNGSNVIKVNFNNLCNYLLYEWNHTYNYLLPKVEIDTSKLVYIYINLIENDITFFDTFLKLSYPKNNIILQINLNGETDYFKKYEKIYRKIIYTNNIFKNIETSNYLSINSCIKHKCDYYMYYNNQCIINKINMIETLMSYDKNIISPLLNENDFFSNFWGSISNDGWYERSHNYFDIRNNYNRGCWNVPYISHIYMIKKSILNNIKYYYTKNIETKNDTDVIFTENLRKNNYFIYTTNEYDYGYLLGDKFHNILSKKGISIFDYKCNKNEWKNKYLVKNFGENIKEPITDVLQFPIFNDVFCKELIQLSEKFNKWSGASHNDSRIGYENIPTNDIHLSEMNLNDIWEQFILDEIAPLVSKHWGSYKTKGINISFVVKYDDNKYYKLEPHHDSSSYTLNIALNDDYEGGGVNFISKKKSINHIKGYGLIHPGKITHYHEGLPVTKGTKYIFVSFID